MELNIDRDTTALTAKGMPLQAITVQPVDPPPAPPEDRHIIGLAYDFGPDRATFDPHASITLQYDPASCPDGVDERDLVIAYYDTNAGEWISLSSEVDTSARIVTAEVSHLTLFAIVGNAAPPSPSGVGWPMVGGIIAAVVIMGVVAYLVVSRRRITTTT